MSEIENGNYMARAIAGSEQYAPTSNGAPQIAVDMQVEGGDFHGTVMTVTLSFSGNAPEWSIKKLRMLGWRGDNLEDLRGISDNAVPVRVFDNEYNGKTFKKMEINLGGGSFKFQTTMDARQKKQFASEFKGLAASFPQRGDAPAPSRGAPPPRAPNGTQRGAPPPPADTGDSDEIPF